MGPYSYSSSYRGYPDEATHTEVDEPTEEQLQYAKKCGESLDRMNRILGWAATIFLLVGAIYDVVRRY